MINVYSDKGVKKGTMRLAKEPTGESGLRLLAQAVHVYEDLAHPGTAKVKTRGEVQASGAKIYRQKGTGKARHGDIAAPIFAGGGIAHGPKGLKRILALPRKMRKSALGLALSLKEKAGEIAVVDGLEKIAKTKDAQNLLKSILKNQAIKTLNSATVARVSENKNAELSFRNIKGVKVVIFDHLNAYSVFNSGFLIIDKQSLAKEYFGKEALAKKGKVGKEKGISKVKSVSSRKITVKKAKKVSLSKVKTNIKRKKK